MKKPKVSIVCISYNQQDYITQAIEGFLIQKTNFPIEIVIADDASTDGTADIIRKYEKNNPGLFQTNLRIKNVGVAKNLIDALKKAQGDYIALCEGDDFWTDPNKLQKQVNFLDTHKSYSLVFHPVRVFFENHEEADAIFPIEKDKKYFTVKNLLRNNYIQTNSVMYRKIKYEDLSLEVMPLDWYLHLIHAQYGKIGFINDVMSSYRRHSGGVWWNQREKPQLIWKKYGYNYLILLHEAMKIYGDSVDNKIIIDQHIAGSFEAISSIKPIHISDDIAIKSLRVMPSETWRYVKSLIQQVDYYSSKASNQQILLNEQTLFYEQKYIQLSDELESYRLSRTLKFVNIMIDGWNRVKRPIHVIKGVIGRVDTKHRN